MPLVRLLIADDHAIVRQGVRALLQEQQGWQVVAGATDGREAVVKAAELNPDLAILDIMMPSLNGLDATKQITNLSVKTVETHRSNILRKLECHSVTQLA